MTSYTLQVDFNDDVVFQFAKFSKNFLVYCENRGHPTPQSPPATNKNLLKVKAGSLFLDLRGAILEHLYKVNYTYVLTQCLGEHIIFSFHSDF